MEGLLGAVTECMLACLWAMVEQEGWVWVVSVALRRRADSQLAGELHEREVIPCTPVLGVETWVGGYRGHPSG